MHRRGKEKPTFFFSEERVEEQYSTGGDSDDK